MKKIKEYKGIIIIVLILILGTFYWYELRPTNIRKKCYNIATSGFSSVGNFNLNYESCLLDNGLEK